MIELVALFVTLFILFIVFITIVILFKKYYSEMKLEEQRRLDLVNEHRAKNQQVLLNTKQELQVFIKRYTK